MKNVTIDNFLHFYHVRQTDSMLPYVCIIDHGGRHNVVITSATHCSTPHGPLFLYLPHFKAICEMLPNRSRATWTFVVNCTSLLKLLTFFQSMRVSSWVRLVFGTDTMQLLVSSRQYRSMKSKTQKECSDRASKNVLKSTICSGVIYM